MMSNEKFLELTIEVLKSILNDTSKDQREYSHGKVLEISEALDVMILEYYRSKKQTPA